MISRCISGANALGPAPKTQPEPLLARRVSKVDPNDDEPRPIASMAKIREGALLAIRPYAHVSERCCQIGLLNRYLDGQYGHSFAVSTLLPTGAD